MGCMVQFPAPSAVVISNLSWRTDKQLDRFRPCFPKRHGMPSANDQRVPSGLIVIIGDRFGAAMWQGSVSQPRPATTAESHRGDRLGLKVHCSRKIEHEGCGEGDGGEEELRTPVVAGRDTAPVLHPAEHDLDAVAAVVASLVVADSLTPQLPTRVPGAYPPCLSTLRGTIRYAPRGLLAVAPCLRVNPCPRSSSWRQEVYPGGLPHRSNR